MTVADDLQIADLYSEGSSTSAVMEAENRKQMRQCRESKARTVSTDTACDQWLICKSDLIFSRRSRENRPPRSNVKSTELTLA